MKEMLADPLKVKEIISNPLVIKYGIGIGILLVVLFLYLALSFIIRKSVGPKNGIVSHFILGAILAFGVFVLSQYLQMVLIDFHIKAITAKMIVIVQMILIGLILIQSLFFMVNSLEHSQIEKGADKTSAKIITRVLKIAIFLVVLLLFGEHFGLSLSWIDDFWGHWRYCDRFCE